MRQDSKHPDAVEAPEDPARLAALQRYAILDTPAEQAYDDITALAAQICDCPISLISLVDDRRQWFKSKIGLEVAETPRDVAFCAHAIRQPDLLIVPDACQDPRFADNPLVTSDPGIRFYAGAPLISSDGYALGTLCVIDRVPRQLSAAQLHALRVLSRQAMAQMQLRQHLADSRQTIEQRDRTAELIGAQRQVLERIVRGTDLEQVLSELALIVETHTSSGGLVSIMLVDQEQGRLRHGAAPSLPEDYNQKVDGVPIGPRGGTCIVAAHSGQSMVAADISTDPVWAPYRDLALSYGLRASWSVPVFGKRDVVLATLGMYYREPRAPTVEDLHLANLITRTTALAIEHKRAEEQHDALLRSEQQARADAEQANREKDEFIGIVSHELRTPLHAILGWSHLLRTESLDQAARARGLETIERNAKTQARLVDDLLDVARILSGKLSLEVRRVNLKSVVARAWESVQVAASQKQLQVRLDGPDETLEVNADPDRLQQILCNLLSNAIKFTPVGGSIEVGATVGAEQVVVSVRDTGCGIRAEFLPHLFGRFSQAQESGTRAHGGLGLGLAIADHLARLHGGRLVAHSDGEGRGATFCLHIPLALEQQSTLDAAAADDTTPAPSTRAISERPLAGLRVLAVDDDLDSRTVLTSLLERAGAETVAAASVPSALERLRTDDYDVLISDIEMPEQSGYDLIRQLRAMPPEQGGDMPAMALTAHASSQERKHSLRAGFDAHVAKPVEPLHLIHTLCGLMASEKDKR